MVIAGRVADVDMALGQDDVRALAVAKAGDKGERSRRMALAKEGQIAEGSPAWEGMSAGDRAKRKRAAGECRAGGGPAELALPGDLGRRANGHMVLVGHGTRWGALCGLPQLLRAYAECHCCHHTACPCGASMLLSCCLPGTERHCRCPAAAAEEKKLKLRSPNFIVSETRLSVRNIPPSWTEKQLKACFISAVGAAPWRDWDRRGMVFEEFEKQAGLTA